MKMRRRGREGASRLGGGRGRPRSYEPNMADLIFFLHFILFRSRDRDNNAHCVDYAELTSF
jgi:hypothetical protein